MIVAEIKAAGDPEQHVHWLLIIPECSAEQRTQLINAAVHTNTQLHTLGEVNFG